MAKLSGQLSTSIHLSKVFQPVRMPDSHNTILYSNWYFQKSSFDEVCLELKTVKSELSKVLEMLEIKVINY